MANEHADEDISCGASDLGVIAAGNQQSCFTRPGPASVGNIADPSRLISTSASAPPRSSRTYRPETIAGAGYEDPDRTTGELPASKAC
jgi:hypothetical protein